MLTTYLLDTNMVSYIVTGQSPAARLRMLSLGEDDICCVSTITEAEIRFGLAKRPKATAFRNVMDSFLTQVRILPWGREEAAAYGLLRAKREAMGSPLGSLDTFIAAHAIAIGAVMVSRDKAFPRVEDLYATVNWATDL